MNAAELLNDAIAAMAKLHGSMTPDERAENAIVPPAAVREFVDAHARLLYEREHLEGIGEQPAGAHLRCRKCGNQQTIEFFYSAHKAAERDMPGWVGEMGLKT